MQTSQEFDRPARDYALYPILGTTIWAKDDPKFAQYQTRIQPKLPHLEWFRSMQSKLGLPVAVVNTAIHYSIRLKREGALTREPIVKEAILFLACRMCGVDRDPKLYSCQRLKVVIRAYQLADVLGIEVRPPSIDRQVFEAFGRLGLSRDVYRDVLVELQKLHLTRPSSRSRLSEAAALTYLKLKTLGRVYLLPRGPGRRGPPRLQFSMKRVAEAFGVSGYTINVVSLNLREERL